MIPLIVLRPPPGCADTLALARARGLEAHGFSMFAVAPRAWQAPPATEFDALLIGSANALRHAGPALAAYYRKPAYAVGARTAEAARAAGLTVIAEGRSGLQSLLPQLRPGHRRLLRLTGETRTEITPSAGVTIAERIVYASEPLAMPQALAALLAAPALALLHSAEAARHFAAECDRCQIDRHRLGIAALGPRIAAAAGDGWGVIAAAARPDDRALLALAAELCQRGDGSGRKLLGI